MTSSIGERIRTQRLLRGLSARQAAIHAGISIASWSRIENGKQRADNRFVIAKIATALRCSVEELTGQPGVASDRAQAEVGGTAYEVMRAVVEADLTYTPADRPGSLDELDREFTLIRDLRDRCDDYAAARRLPELIRALHATAFGPARASALRLLVRTHETASFGIRYLGEPASSVLVGERAQQAAELLGDPVMLGLAAYSRAHGATGVGLYQRAQLVADTAAADLAAHSDLPDALEVRGQLLLTAAFGAYALGDESGAADRIAEAETIAAATGQTTTLGLNFGPTNIRFWRVSMEADGGDPGKAIAMAAETSAEQVASVSRRATFYLDVARALAAIGRDPEAVRMLAAAERLAPARTRANPLAAETVRTLLDRARRRSTGELYGLAERISGHR
jgi:transcriptional regulator with XRE-family HTH domain